jgi:hypothetical protein
MRTFIQVLKPSDDSTILDCGGFPSTWMHFPYRSNITTLNIQPAAFVQTPDFPPIKTVVGDGCQLDYGDASFEVVFSNSVIEHLSSFERQMAFACEARRVGRKLWIQTPAKEFFVEPHLLTPFVHFLPVSLQRRVIRRLTVWGIVTRPSPAQIEAFLKEVRLLSFAEMQQLFPDCEVRRETAGGFTKSYVAVRQGA